MNDSKIGKANMKTIIAPNTVQATFELIVGTPQSRLHDNTKKGNAKLYVQYGQLEMDEDLVNSPYSNSNEKTILTTDKVDLVHTGDVIFGFVSGRATLVRPIHDNYLFTQNFVKLEPRFTIDPKYLVYLFNENQDLRNQLERRRHGTRVITMKQLRELELPELPPYERQKVIGELYFNQKQLDSLRHRVAELQDQYVMEILKGN
jgi:restriction endonuclease S subunit